MPLYEIISKSPLIPWRFRNAFENWVENTAHNKHPSLYRYLHFGQKADPIRRITSGPKHHFYGYYEKSPWDKSQQYIAAHQVEFNDRPPIEDDRAEVGIIDLQRDNSFIPIGNTRTWNFQQGAMLQWHPTKDDCLFFNSIDQDSFISILVNTNGREIKRFSRPIYAISPTGETAYSLNYSRLATHRPGYGYCGSIDEFKDEYAPKLDGIWKIDLTNDTSDLIITLAQLVDISPKDSMKDAHHWINHIQINPSGNRIAFFHLWRYGETGWRGRLYTADQDGSNLKLILDNDVISHYDWLDDESILIWANNKNSKPYFLLCDITSVDEKIIGDGVLVEDGHCSFSPNRAWVLNDTYPDRFDMRTLMLYNLNENHRIDIARLFSPKDKWWGEIRCDLHPRWNRIGNEICIDSVHDGTRQMYIADISNYLR